MTNAGIDYGMGRSNIDVVSGIRYGVIAQNSVLQAWSDSAEPDYGKAHCPKCGNEAIEYDSDKDVDFACGHGCADFMCESCEYVFDGDEAYPDEDCGWNYSGDGYELTDCLDYNIFVLNSKYYTFAKFCSPCVPGAGDLDNPIEDGAKTYCLGHDWFEDGKAPYAVYSVETGEEIKG